MLFNSLPFLLFFSIVYPTYLLLSHRWQNRFLLAASYFFYGSWDWRFLFLLWITTLTDFYAGHLIAEARNQSEKKFFLILSLIVNLGVLGFFKYYNFFADSLTSLLGEFGWQAHLPFLKVILPIGISFYTFQSINYTIDIYRGMMKPTRKILDFALFVAFFPHLVAGPIVRAEKLLPQVESPRKIQFQQIKDGIFLSLWGLFKKIFIADSLAPIVNCIFAKNQWTCGWEILLGVYAFAFQIYSDFSGYTDIARGVAKLMGFELSLNFNLPYFSQRPSEFWHRWHISLSSWFRDYLYIPLGGNRKGHLRTLINLMLTMTLAGLWHGAGWTFIVWGAYHGLLLIGEQLLGRILPKPAKEIPDHPFRTQIASVGRMVLNFHLVCIGWLFFRASSMAQAGKMLGALFGGWKIDWPTFYYFKEFALCTFILIFFQIVQWMKKDLYWIVSAPTTVKVTFVSVVAAFIFVFFSIGKLSSSDFIYFQF